MSVTRKSGPGRKELERITTGIKDATLSVGWFKSAKYEDGTPVAMVATVHEFGSPSQGIPPRPFMRPTIMDNKEKWRQIALWGAKRIISGEFSARQALDALGLQASGDIAKTISQIYSPPLKQKTVKNRMRRRKNKKTVGNLTKPLVDQAIMINSVTYEVTEK